MPISLLRKPGLKSCLKSHLILRLATVMMIAASSGLSGCSDFARRQAQTFDLGEQGAGGTAITFGHTVANDSHSTALIASGDLNGNLTLSRFSVSDPGVHTPRSVTTRRIERAHEGGIRGLIHTGNHWITAAEDGRVKAWTMDGAQTSAASVVKPATALAVLDSRSVVVGTIDGQLWQLHLPDLKLMSRHQLRGGSLSALTIHPATGRVAASGANGRVWLWDDIAAPPHLLPRARRQVRALAFTPDGNALLGGGWFDLYRWDLAAGRITTLASGQHGRIAALAFTPDGRLASIGRITDSAVNLHDPRTGAVVHRYAKHALCGSALAISPDGRWLATTSDDATVHLYALDSTPTPRP